MRVRRKTSVGTVRADGEGKWPEHIFSFPFCCMWHGFDILPFFFLYNSHNSRLLMCGYELLFLNGGSLNKC